MSIKPIDFHLTYANTVNESKTKQIDFNRLKESNQMAQHQQQVETQRSRKRISESEESKGKTINNQQKNRQNPRDGSSASTDEKEPKNENAKSSLPKDELKGLKIDIMI